MPVLPLRAGLLRTALLTLLLSPSAAPLRTFAQRPPEQPDASRILHRMHTLNTLGSVLYIAAHPDDENTRLISWLANGKHFRTGYLSLTRGEGGQNLIGPELGDALGIIRTEELLEARRIDGGEQFFTRAVDFGFSKNAAESFEKWGRNEILGDVVRVIRTFRPDILITRFPPDRGAGHGHHEASAILAREAFDLAGDPDAFPEQLQQGLEVWKPKRLLFNGSTWWRKDLNELAQTDPDWYTVDVGGYDPLLGLSYTEIAGRSRSMHKSQGFGAEQRRGEMLEYLHFEKGDKPRSRDLFEGVDATWGRLLGGAPITAMVDRMIAAYDVHAPERSAAALVAIRAAIDALPTSVWTKRMRALTDDLLVEATGTVVEAMATTPQVVTGDTLEVAVSVLTRSQTPVSVTVAKDRTYVPHASSTGYNTVLHLAAPDRPDMPYWLASPHGNRYAIADVADIGKPVTPEQLQVDVTLDLDGALVQRRVPVLYRWVDRVKGELLRSCAVVPPVSLHASPSVVMVRDTAATVHLGIEAFADLKRTELICELVAGWDIAPARQQLGPLARDERRGAEFRMAPEGAVRKRTDPVLRVASSHAGPGNLTRRVIQYDHIMPQTWYTPADLHVVPLSAQVDAKRVGYIRGAGDEVPTALKQLGLVVDMLDPNNALTTADLARYDAIVTGIRAYNTVKALKYMNDSLLAYVANGGTLVVQYNTNGDDLVMDPAHIGPYPFKLTRDRVTVEEAAPTFLAPEHPLLNTPNKITEKDFEGWVQERGLYFCGDLDPHYTPLIAWNDPGEQPLNGALIACDHGKGRFVYTGISFFRQLPAGVPGAYRLFANLLSRRDPDRTIRGSGH